MSLANLCVVLEALRKVSQARTQASRVLVSRRRARVRPPASLGGLESAPEVSGSVDSVAAVPPAVGHKTHLLQAEDVAVGLTLAADLRQETGYAKPKT